MQSLVLGLVEGITEYLPVSSTAHLILAQRLMGIPEDRASNAYAICIQAGAILAVLILYYGRVRQAVLGVLGRDALGRALAVNLLAAFLPAAMCGLLLEHRIKAVLFNLPSIAAAWVVGGIAILLLRVGRNTGKPLESLRWRGAFAIGAFQVLAMWPGVSRSLVTILGGLAVGLSLSAAVEFSFLLGLVTLSAATAKDAFSDGRVMIEAYGVLALMVGFVAATLSALAAVRWMVGWLVGHGLNVFGWYRVVAGSLLAGALAGGLVGCNGDSGKGAVLDAVIEVSDGAEATTALSAARCVHQENGAMVACAWFRDLDGTASDAMRQAEVLCLSNGGTWEAGDCDQASATARCEQPGNPPHFLQVDWCYGDPEVCRATCVGVFTTL